MEPNSNTIQDQDLLFIVYDNKKRKWLRKVESGKQFHTDRGYLDYDDIIGKEYGTVTALPRCFPGFHFGIALTTRTAS